jgi:SEC-C motif
MKVGRNDPCPCGSGKKYKKCCLEKDQVSKGELGREQIQRYIAARHAGEIGRDDQEFAGPFRSKKQKQRPKAAAPEHPLCPDRRTLDAYLAGLNLDFSPQNYRIAATFELVPA